MRGSAALFLRVYAPTPDLHAVAKPTRTRREYATVPYRNDQKYRCPGYWLTTDVRFGAGPHYKRALL